MVFSAEAKRASQPKGATGKERCSPRSPRAGQEGCRRQALWPQLGELVCWDVFPPGAASPGPGLNKGRACLPSRQFLSNCPSAHRYLLPTVQTSQCHGLLIQLLMSSATFRESIISNSLPSSGTEG